MVTLIHFLNILALDQLSFISNIISVKILSDFSFHIDDVKYPGIYSLTLYLLMIFPHIILGKHIHDSILRIWYYQ